MCLCAFSTLLADSTFMFTTDMLSSILSITWDLDQEHFLCNGSLTRREPKLLLKVFRERSSRCQHASQVTGSLEIPPHFKVLEWVLIVLRQNHSYCLWLCAHIHFTNIHTEFYGKLNVLALFKMIYRIVYYLFQLVTINGQNIKENSTPNAGQ